MGSVGDAYDNAMCESFNATLECELLVQHRFKTQREAALAVFDFIEGWYNPHRRHSALGYLSPNNYERRMRSSRLMSKSQLSTKAGQLQPRRNVSFRSLVSAMLLACCAIAIIGATPSAPRESNLIFALRAAVGPEAVVSKTENVMAERLREANVPFKMRSEGDRVYVAVRRNRSRWPKGF